MRIPFFLSLVMALFLLPLEVLGGPVTVTGEAPEKVDLGAAAHLAVTVQHTEGGSGWALTHSFYGASVRITFENREFLYARFEPPFQGGRYPMPGGPPTPIAAGTKESLDIPLLLPRAGVYKIQIEYRGRKDDPERGPAVHSSVPREILVAPKGKERDLTVRVRTDMGTFTLGFWPNEALGTVLNFLDLSDKGFYDGTRFHRIIDGFMSQGGDPKGDGSGGPSYSIPNEFNARTHAFGVISMARSQHVDSAGSQFFLCADEAAFLDRQYTGFGIVISGLDIAGQINDVGSDDPNGVPPKKTVTLLEARVMVGSEPVKRAGEKKD